MLIPDPNAPQTECSRFVDATDQWIGLYLRAMEILTSARFEKWMFGVGMSGTDEERYRKGLAILEALKPAPVGPTFLDLMQKSGNYDSPEGYCHDS